MKFTPHIRLLETLVGSNLYPQSDVAVRELVQNAWDAVEWRRSRSDGGGAAIAVRYSEAGGWMEVADDGVGMTQKEVEDVLLQVGRSKFEALGVEAGSGEQIALFGVGFLSVFLIGDQIDVRSRKVGEETGVVVEITGIEDEVSIRDDPAPGPPGTTVRVYFRTESTLQPSGVPDAVRKYVRHVPGVTLTDFDAGSTVEVRDTWETSSLWDVTALDESTAVRGARAGFSSGLREASVVSNAFVLSNAGFLVEERALDLLPLPATSGFGGELDLHPTTLSIVIARERYQRDERWRALGQELRAAFIEHALQQLLSGSLQRRSTLDSAEVRKTLIVWEITLPDDPDLGDLRDAIRDRLWSTTPFQLAERGLRSLTETFAKLPRARLYVRRTATAMRATRHIDDDGSPLQLQEEIRDSVRIGALRARGYEVVEVGQIRLTQELPGGASDLILEEEQAVRRVAEARGVEVLDITAAPHEDLDLEAVEILPVLRGFLSVAGGLRFARVPDSKRRVIADSSGVHYLNVENQIIARLLKSIAHAIDNPLKRKLLEIYVALEDLERGRAIALLLELLESDDLAGMANAEVAPLTREYLERAVAELSLNA